MHQATTTPTLHAELTRLAAVLDGASAILGQLTDSADTIAGRQTFAVAALLDRVSEELEALAGGAA
jgi:hypothetical protein